MVALLAMIFATPIFAAENNANELNVQLKQMAKELESNDNEKIKSFIEKYAFGKDLETIMTTEKIDELVETFKGENKEILKNHIILASNMSPEISEDNVTYTYDHEKDPTGTMTRGLIMVYNPDTKIFHIKN